MRSDDEIRNGIARLDADFSHGVESPPSAVWTSLADVIPLLDRAVAAEQERDELRDVAEGWKTRFDAARAMGNLKRIALAGLRELHQPIEHMIYGKVCEGCSRPGAGWEPWPCPTLAAVEQPEPTEPDVDIYETAVKRLANDDGRRFTLAEVEAELTATTESWDQ